MAYKVVNATDSPVLKRVEDLCYKAAPIYFHLVRALHLSQMEALSVC